MDEEKLKGVRCTWLIAYAPNGMWLIEESTTAHITCGNYHKGVSYRVNPRFRRHETLEDYFGPRFQHGYSGDITFEEAKERAKELAFTSWLAERGVIDSSTKHMEHFRKEFERTYGTPLTCLTQ